MFDGLTSLLVLDLSGNQLTTLPDSAFNGLTSLVAVVGERVVGMSLLESAGGQLTNISTAGVAGVGE